MTSTAQTIDQAKLDQFMSRFVGDLGAAMSAALVVIGDRLGLYRAMADGEPVTPEELAKRTGTDTRYVREWLCNQAAGGYVAYDGSSDRFSLTAEQSLALAQEDSPAFVPGAFQVATAHVLETLDPDGTWMIVEPYANDRLEDNLNPVGRMFYGASTLVCTPASRDQEVGLALGAQAGEQRLREVVTAGGFTRFRRATETPFNLVLEARP
jgi:hypothetical protein